jgi:hypothetical protein
MLNPAQRVMVARGLSGVGLGNAIDDAFNRINQDADPSGGGWYQDWGQGVIGQAGSILTGLFGHNNTQGLTAAQLQAQIAAQIAAQNAARTASNSSADDSGIGIKFTDKGLQLGSSTTISYSMMMIGGLALFLVQSSGFQKRR